MKTINKPPIEIIFHSSIISGASVPSVGSWVGCDSITIFPSEKFASEPEDEMSDIILCSPSLLSSEFPFRKITKSVITLPLLNHWTTHIIKSEILFSKALFNTVSRDDLRELYSGLFTLAYCDFQGMFVMVNLPLNSRGFVTTTSLLSKSPASVFSVGDTDDDDDDDNIDGDGVIVITACWGDVAEGAIELSFSLPCDKIDKPVKQERKKCQTKLLITGKCFAKFNWLYRNSFGYLLKNVELSLLWFKLRRDAKLLTSKCYNLTRLINRSHFCLSLSWFRLFRAQIASFKSGAGKVSVQASDVKLFP